MSSKVFFHPVLRSQSNDYVDDSFIASKVDCKVKNADSVSYLTLVCTYRVINQKIQLLCRSGEVAAFLVAYCSDTLKRFSWPILHDSQTFDLPIGSIIGSLKAQVVIVAVDSLNVFVPSGANDEFGKNEFRLRPGAPLALGDIHSFEISTKKRKLLNIMRVQKSTDLHPDIYDFVLSSTSITILMGERMFRYFNLMKSDSTFKPHLFPSIYKDALVEAIRQIVEDDSIREFPWAQKLMTLVDDDRIFQTSKVDLQRVNQVVCKLLAEKGIGKVLSNVSEN